MRGLELVQIGLPLNQTESGNWRMSTRISFPQPPDLKKEHRELRAYLNELVRTLEHFDDSIFSQETGLMYQTSRLLPVVTTTSAYTMGGLEGVVLANSSAGGFAVTLPTALKSKGKFFEIKKIDANIATIVSVEASGPEFPYLLSSDQRPSLTVCSDGTNFWVV